jgi:2-amino-4-hydroxy-6-hydroxymethyldihydropteridine diphosphokinase
MPMAYIALGSNLDQPMHQLQQAVQTIKKHPSMQWILGSWVYISAPIGPQDQDDFHNACIVIATELSPEQLLLVLQSIEQQQQRKRTRHWGPRTLDLDIIYYTGESRQTPELSLPHPLATQRLFVLLPLQDLAFDKLLQNQPLDHWIQACCTQILKQTSVRLV